MKILYLHGWNSGVGGVKPTYLKSHGYDVHEPALDHDDFQAALDTGQAASLMVTSRFRVADVDFWDSL